MITGNDPKRKRAEISVRNKQHIALLMIATFASSIIAMAPNTIASAQSTTVDYFLHGTGPNNNPPVLYLDSNTPTITTAKFRDSASVNFAGGNPWKEIGTWTTSSPPSTGTLTSLSDLRIWLGLKNSDDQGTRFDLRAEVYKDDTLVASGETKCITGITRNPANAMETIVSFGAFAPELFDGTDDLSLKVLTRIGTNPDDTFCGGHSNAVGLRAYFDSVSRPSMFDATFTAIVTGNTITTVDSADDVGSLNSMTVGADGLPVIAYFDETNDDLKVLKCGTADCSSGNIITTVDSAGRVGLYPSIAIGTDGFPVISYYQDEGIGDLKMAKCGNAACSSGNTIIVVDSAGDVGSHTSIGIGTDGFPVISYRDETNGDLKVAKCGDAACTSGNTITPVDTAGSTGSYTSLKIGTDGMPVIAYKTEAVHDVKVVKCGDSSCSSGNNITTVATDGTYTSLAIGADGFPVVSYWSFILSDLNVVKCGNAACSSGNINSIVDSAGSVGLFTSIAIGSDGLPVISYHDEGMGDLKVAKCTNAACSIVSVINTIDTVGDVGESTSIAIGTDGFPVMSYHDVTNRDLKVAKCSSITC